MSKGLFVFLFYVFLNVSLEQNDGVRAKGWSGETADDGCGRSKEKSVLRVQRVFGFPGKMTDSMNKSVHKCMIFEMVNWNGWSLDVSFVGPVWPGEGTFEGVS